MYIYGKNVAMEALSQKGKVRKAFVYKKFNDKELLNEIRKQNIKISYLEKHELDKIEDGNHQGIILDVMDYEYASLDDVMEEDIIVMLVKLLVLKV